MAEKRLQGASWLTLAESFPLPSTTMRRWMRRLVDWTEALPHLTAWATQQLPNWLPPAGLVRGGLHGLFSVIASLQVVGLCPQQWLDWFQSWICAVQFGSRGAATNSGGGRSP